MTPKEEVYAALLNNSNISEEAATYLNKILNNESNESSNSSNAIIEQMTYKHDNLYSYHEYYESERDADEIKADIEAGKNVIFNFDKWQEINDRSLTEPIYLSAMIKYNCYMPNVYYYDNEGSPVNDGFAIFLALPTEQSAYHNASGWCTKGQPYAGRAGSNGKLHFPLYVD